MNRLHNVSFSTLTPVAISNLASQPSLLVMVICPNTSPSFLGAEVSKKLTLAFKLSSLSPFLTTT
jgi:hypothetical protein